MKNFSHIAFVYEESVSSFMGEFLLATYKYVKLKCIDLSFIEISRAHMEEPEKIHAEANFKAIDAVVLVSPSLAYKAVYDLIKSQQVQCFSVLADREINASLEFNLDEYHAFFKLTDYLIKEGHHKIAYVRGEFEQGKYQARYRGYLDAITSNELDLPIEYIQHCTSGESASKALLNLNCKPSAIIYAHQELAESSLPIVNEDSSIQIASFVHSMKAKYRSNKVTYIGIPVNKLVQDCFSQMLKYMQPNAKAKSLGNKVALECEILSSA